MGKRKQAGGHRKQWSTGGLRERHVAMRARAAEDVDDFTADRHADIDAEAFELGDYLGEDDCV